LDNWENERLQYWCNGVIDISKYYNSLIQNNDEQIDIKIYDFTKNFLIKTYAFDGDQVLFKPTLGINPQFCNDLEQAIDYFCGSVGFATKNYWENIRFEHSKNVVIGETYLSMGNYFFTKNKDVELKVEYTFVYNKKGKIVLHHSSLPFSSSHYNIIK
jgi:hypothetical protein